jgi:hypothetical protein
MCSGRYLAELCGAANPIARSIAAIPQPRYDGVVVAIYDLSFTEASVTKFSARFGYDPNLPKEALLEDAPEGMRIAYLNSILQPIVYWAGSDADNEENRPLEIVALSREFCAIARQEMPEFDRYSSVWDDLKGLLKNGSWFNFYDFVEHVGKKLLNIQSQYAYLQTWLDGFGFETHRAKVNGLFAEDRIGWRLSETSELEREMPKSLSTRLSATIAGLQDGFDPAREHYLKAIRYASARPLDAENSIKETTSSIESVGRVFYPKAQTLGDVVKEMRQKGGWPPALVSMMEKFYAYASSEPAVRHGAPVSSRVSLADAEFCLHVGAAMIRYMLEKTHSQRKNPTSAT